MTTIKSFHMKNISVPKEENGMRFRKGILYSTGAKAGFFHYYESGKEPDIWIREQFQEKWDKEITEFHQERAPKKAVSPAIFFVETLVELIDFEKRYRVQQKRGNSIMVIYIEMKTEDRHGEMITRPSGRRVLFNANDMAEVEAFEEQELAHMTFERKLFASLDDFILE